MYVEASHARKQARRDASIRQPSPNRNRASKKNRSTRHAFDFWRLGRLAARFLSHWLTRFLARWGEPHIFLSSSFLMPGGGVVVNGQARQTGGQARELVAAAVRRRRVRAVDNRC
jgi:hypothetical protein